MYRMAVLGEYDSIFGFAALGLDTFPIENPEEAKRELARLAVSSYAVIYITEALAKDLEREIEHYRQERLPAIILIPGVFGNTGAGVSNVKRSVEQAVGSDILFGTEE